MPPPPFDFDALFDADYRYFYETLVSPEQTAEEVELIDELLGLERSDDLLDLACGYGRISIGLAQRGLTVVGLDRSAALLESAREDANLLGAGIEFVEGDMRELPWQARFDAVICWFTSFGFFDDDELRGVLRQMRRALRPGGRVLIETLNRDRLLENFQDSTVVERDDALMIDRNTFDTLTRRTAPRSSTSRSRVASTSPRGPTRTCPRGG